MGTDISKSMGNVPAHIAKRMALVPADNLSDDLSGGLSTGGVPRISLKASRFRLVENGAEIKLRDTELEVIIIGAAKGLSKVFYANPWDPDSEPAAPDCWSMDGIYPDESIADPENDKCATCPKNQWGSKMTPAGKQIKACADQKRLAVVAAADPGTVYLVQVTPAALQGLAKYNGELKARGLRPDWVITILSFDGDASFPKLLFSFGGFPTDEAMEAVDAIDTNAILRVTSGDMTISTAPALPRQEPEATAPKPKPKLQAVPKEEEDDAPAEPAPKPKRRMARQPVENDAPKPKPKPEPEVVEDEDEGTASFGKPKPKPRAVAGAVIDANDEDDAPPAKDPRMGGLVDSISARLGDMYADEDDDA